MYSVKTPDQMHQRFSQWDIFLTLKIYIIICLNLWIRNYWQFYVQNFAYLNLWGTLQINIIFNLISALALISTHWQALKYLKISTCPASQKLLAYMGKYLIFIRNFKIFTCPAAWGTRKYERTSAIFEPWLSTLLKLYGFFTLY